jgi:integrase
VQSSTEGFAVAHVNRLSASFRPKRPGMYCDGLGLYLQVTERSKGHVNESWVLRYAIGGKPRYMGLGRRAEVTVAQAREKCRELRQLIREGLDPIRHRDTQKAKNLAAQAELITFDDCAAQYIRQHQAGWRNPKHAAQWSSTIKTYASPRIGKMSVADITTTHVMKVLEPIWQTKTETASRVRGRVESILDWATTCGYRQGDNPARWNGCLENLLPAPSKVRKVEHHAALPYADVPAFMAELRQREGVAALALEFTILTAARSGEVRLAAWSEMDVHKKTWTIPAERMKGGRGHVVPLCERTLEILESLRGQGSGLVFPGQYDKPLSDMSLTAVLRRMGRGDLTAHGFRSSFRDWCGDETDFARETAEAALAHVVGDKAEQAYRRSDALEKRRRLMQAWADYCEGEQVGKVVKLRG